MDSDDPLDSEDYDTDSSVDENMCCEVCSKGDNDDTIVLCDGKDKEGLTCNRGFHLQCLKMKTVPKGKWFCNECKASQQYETSAAVHIDIRNVLDILQDRISKRFRLLGPSLEEDIRDIMRNGVEGLLTLYRTLGIRKPSKRKVSDVVGMFENHLYMDAATLDEYVFCL